MESDVKRKAWQSPTAGIHLWLGETYLSGCCQLGVALVSVPRPTGKLQPQSVHSTSSPTTPANDIGIGGALDCQIAPKLRHSPPWPLDTA